MRTTPAEALPMFQRYWALHNISIPIAQHSQPLLQCSWHMHRVTTWCHMSSVPTGYQKYCHPVNHWQRQNASTLSMDLIILSQSKRNTRIKDHNAQTSLSTSPMTPSWEGKQNLRPDKIANALLEYVVRHIVPHVDKDTLAKVFICWFGCTTFDDVVAGSSVYLMTSLRATSTRCKRMSDQTTMWTSINQQD